MKKQYRIYNHPTTQDYIYERTWGRGGEYLLKRVDTINGFHSIIIPVNTFDVFVSSGRIVEVLQPIVPMKKTYVP
jgi:hypothetical protein